MSSKLINKQSTNLEGSFEETYSLYFKRMFLYARKLLRSDHLAEDAVEEVFYNLWKTKSDFSKIRELETYLFVAVKNQAIRMLSRDPHAFVSLDLQNELKQIEHSNPEDLLIEKELADLIDHEIAKLSGQCQIIFTMARKEHKDYKDIAAEMGISVDSVKSQIYKAASKIRECVASWKKADGTDKAYMKGLGSVLLLIVYFLLF